jgi:hypothetical protein
MHQDISDRIYLDIMDQNQLIQTITSERQRSRISRFLIFFDEVVFVAGNADSLVKMLPIHDSRDKSFRPYRLVFFSFAESDIEFHLC